MQRKAPGGSGEGTEGKPRLFARLLRVAPEAKPRVRPHHHQEVWEWLGCGGRRCRLEHSELDLLLLRLPSFWK